MKLTTIQVREETRRELERRKSHPRETYDAIVTKMLKEHKAPTLEEAFAISDRFRQKRTYSTEEVVKMKHELWEKK
jgi:pantoate kinase